MKTRFVVLFAAFVFLAALLPVDVTTHAQGSVEARVIYAAINVRANPGEDSARVGTYAIDTIVVVSGREDQMGNGGIWVFTEPKGGGTQGWVLWNLLEFPDGFIVEDLPVINATGVATDSDSDNGAGSGVRLNAVTNGGANFREGPGTQFGLVDGLVAGQSLTLTGRTGNGTWYQAVANGQGGWIYYSLVDVDGNVNSLDVIEDGLPAAGAATQTDTTTPDTGSSPAVSVGAPVYSSANLNTFSYGAHIAGFANVGRMHQAGMTWAKQQVIYGRGADPNGVAGMINTAHGNGLRILISVTGHPHEVATGGDGYFQDYANFVGGLAALGADGIEVWNEPNLDREWPHGQINPARYTQLLAMSYNAIKSRNPGTIVVSGAPAPTGAESAFGLDAVWNDNRFLAGMRDAGAARYMDCLGAHYNEGIISPYQTSGDPRADNYYTRYFWGMVNTYRSIFPGKAICFTELGYLSPQGFPGLPPAFGWAGNVTVAQQAQWLADVIRLARGSGTVKLVIIWNLDFTGWGSDPQGGYAIIRPDGSCPACELLGRQ